ncbi:MAG: aspartate-semialdehyde dehydrogenase [Chloroflexota bacterium]|nr:aspartate-semialdehyde dehydrogenase [Dehalococcoidia bacterium]MDW8252293.1 aspartate-semialdehyde dehydrogenase [Chloroflexota bacterium]
MARLRTAVIGATGVVGQQFLVALRGHPWFAVEGLVASSRSAGKPYREAIRDGAGALRWYVAEPPPPELLDLPVSALEDFDPERYDLIFSAVESDLAKEIEPRFGAVRPVVTTASAFRYFEDTPLVIPGVNNDHIQLVRRQQAARGWKGFVVPQPNCTTTGLAITLKPLHDRFGLRLVVMTSLQALSGAGRSPGVAGLDILDNVIPYIPNEEEKVQRETRKILGTLTDDGIVPARFAVSCTCTRVNVLDGHTETVFVSLDRPATLDEVKAALREYDGFGSLRLPSAPPEYILVHDDPFRPQPRLDRDTNEGMTTVVGRLRADPALENGVKYVLVSHNTKMGAARGAVLTAELLVCEGLLG